MNDKEIDLLKHLVKLDSVAWNPDSHTCRIIVKVGAPRSSDPDHPDYEVNDCAYFENGEYVALDNVPLTDFSIVRKITRTSIDT